MSRATTFTLTLIAMMAFAGNSLLCRAALRDTPIDAATFTSVRLLSGALVLWLLLRLRHAPVLSGGNWGSAFALFLYAAAFSYAYITLPASSGALLLFGAVQITMIGYGLWLGERLSSSQTAGVVIAIVGLLVLLLPGATTPPLLGGVLMLSSGVAWGIYSLRGRGAEDPVAATAGNFIRTLPMTLLLSLVTLGASSPDSGGILYAILSGALASGAGYTVWYTALRGLTAATAATVQLSVPVITGIGGILFLAETPSARLLLASLAILGGIALVAGRKITSRTRR